VGREWESMSPLWENTCGGLQKWTGENSGWWKGTKSNDQNEPVSWERRGSGVWVNTGWMISKGRKTQRKNGLYYERLITTEKNEEAWELIKEVKKACSLYREEEVPRMLRWGEVLGS